MPAIKKPATSSNLLSVKISSGYLHARDFVPMKRFDSVEPIGCDNYDQFLISYFRTSNVPHFDEFLRF